MAQAVPSSDSGQGAAQGSQRRAGSRRAGSGSARFLGLTGLGLALLMVGDLRSRAGEITAAGGGRSLGTLVNGGSSCQSGACAVSGGTKAGSNLFHRFAAFDTRGGITGVSIQTYGLRNLMVGVMNPLGSFIDKPISLSGAVNLFWLSPGGIHLAGAGSFSNIQSLHLSTATGLRFADGGLFDVFATSATQASALSAQPLTASGLVTDPASLSGIGLNGNGDLSIDGGLLTVDNSLLLDAQGAMCCCKGQRYRPVQPQPARRCPAAVSACAAPRSARAARSTSAAARVAASP